ncbi:T9SS type A sorting domain-containing protein [bacterium]|nr:T9SS type A sorting domain-containing protein [bacterium]
MQKKIKLLIMVQFGLVMFLFAGSRPDPAEKQAVMVQPDAPYWEEILIDDFEGDFPWPTWKLIDTVTGDFQWGVVSAYASSGSHCLWCAGRSTSGPRLNPLTDRPLSKFNTNIETIAPLDLSDCTNAELIFDIMTTGSDEYGIHLSVDGPFEAYFMDPTSGIWEEIHAPVTDDSYIHAIGRDDIQLHIGTLYDTKANGQGYFIDNIRYRKYRPGVADLLCESASFSSGFSSPGDFISVSAILKNNGGYKNMQTSKILYYLSLDAVFSPDEDILLGYDFIGELDSQGTQTVHRFCRIPETVPLGSYFQLTVIDPDEEVLESDKSNNIHVSGQPVLIVRNQEQEYNIEFRDDFEGDFRGAKWNVKDKIEDFALEDWGFGWNPTTFQPYSGSRCLWCLNKIWDKNLYTTIKMDPSDLDHPVPPYYTEAEFFSSVDLSDCAEAYLIFDYRADDIPNSHFYIRTSYPYYYSSFFNNRDYKTVNNWIQIQIALSTVYQDFFGRKNVLMKIEYENSISKVSFPGVFLDNFILLKYKPKAELNFTALHCSDPYISPGESLPVTWKLANQGHKAAGNMNVHFYLSEDTTASPDDLWLKTTQLNGLDANTESEEYISSFTVHSQIPKGTYYLIAAVDPEGMVAELIEDNNVTVFAEPVTIGDPEKQVTIGTDPLPVSFFVDGVTYESMTSFSWQTAQNHTLYADSLVFPAGGLRCRFISWSDGAQARMRSVTASAIPDTLTMLYALEYRLTVHNVMGSNEQSWVSAGASVTLTPDSLVSIGPVRYRLNGWTGDVQSGRANLTLVMNGSKAIQALWQKQFYLDLSVYHEEGGAIACSIPGRWIDEKHCIELTAVADTLNGYVFTVWRGDIVSAQNPVALLMDTTKVVQAHFSQASRIASAGLIPAKYDLYQNHPNPFNPETTLRYDLPVASDVHVLICDMLGKIVYENRERQDAGQYRIRWRAMDGTGRLLPSGVYFCRMEAGEYTAVRKMVVVR